MENVFLSLDLMKNTFGIKILQWKMEIYRNKKKERRLLEGVLVVQRNRGEGLGKTFI